MLYFYTLNKKARDDNNALADGNINLEKIYINDTNNIKETLFWFVK